MKRNKILLLVASFVALTLAVTAGMSLAYLTDTDQKVTNVTIGKPGVEVIENNSSTPGSTNLVSYGSKKVKVMNTGTIPEYVRVVLVPSYKFSGSTASQTADAGTVKFGAMPASIAGSTFSMGDLQFTLNSSWQNDWIYAYNTTEKTGYFYYKNRLPVGAVTPNTLLESVSLAGGAGTTLNSMLSNLQIEVIADSIQAEGGAVTQVWGQYVQENTSSHTLSAKTTP